jgi:hypothetical protein
VNLGIGLAKKKEREFNGANDITIDSMLKKIGRQVAFAPRCMYVL